MLNGYTLVGRLVYMGEDYIVLSVTRRYKNSDGEYESDKFNIYLDNNIAIRTKEYCKVGDLIGVRGTMQSLEYEVDGKMYRKLKLLADKISFLASGSHSKGDEDTTDNFTKVSNAFNNCSSLKSIPDLSGLKTYKGDSNEES